MMLTEMNKTTQKIKRSKRLLQIQIDCIPGFTITKHKSDSITIYTKESSLDFAQIQTAWNTKYLSSFVGDGITPIDQYSFSVDSHSPKFNETLVDFLDSLIPVGKMHPKCIQEVNEALSIGKLKGIKLSCPYAPCHQSLQDCTFCYCPFYPCKDPRTGGQMIPFLRKKTSLWDCSNCHYAHNRDINQHIMVELLSFRVPFDKIPRPEIMKIFQNTIGIILDQSIHQSKSNSPNAPVTRNFGETSFSKLNTF